MAATAINPALLANMSWIKPPMGEQTDFNTTETIAPVYTGVSIATLVLALGAMGVRFYVKGFIQKKLWIDDACLSAGLIFQCAYIGIVIQNMYPLGAGKHAWNVHITNAKPFAAMANNLAIISEPLQMFVSWGLLFFYLQLFGPNKIVRWSSYFTIGFVFVVYLIPMILYPAFSDVTKPINTTIAYWNNTVVGILNVLTNLMIMAIPIFAIMKLQMSQRRKLGVLAVFATGFLAVIMSIIGLVYRAKSSSELDITWTVIPRWIVTTVEINVGLICACLPLFPAIFQQKQLRSRLKPSAPDYNEYNSKKASRKGLMGNSSMGHSTYTELDDVTREGKEHKGNTILVTRQYDVHSEVSTKPAQMV